jgi:predicted RNase H-like nuclease
MKTATTPQLIKLHALLNNLGIMDAKAEIIYNLTEGRTKSSKALTIDEASKLITNLAGYDPSDKIRRVIFSLAYQAGIIYGDTAEDKKMNTAKLNMFLKEKGVVKMELSQMNYNELVKTHRQFEAIAKNVEKAKTSKIADRAVKELLTEFNITVK